MSGRCFSVSDARAFSNCATVTRLAAAPAGSAKAASRPRTTSLRIATTPLFQIAPPAYRSRQIELEAGHSSGVLRRDRLRIADFRQWKGGESPGGRMGGLKLRLRNDLCSKRSLAHFFSPHLFLHPHRLQPIHLTPARRRSGWIGSSKYGTEGMKLALAALRNLI